MIKSLGDCYLCYGDVGPMEDVPFNEEGHKQIACYLHSGSGFISYDGVKVADLNGGDFIDLSIYNGAFYSEAGSNGCDYTTVVKPNDSPVSVEFFTISESFDNEITGLDQIFVSLSNDILVNGKPVAKNKWARVKAGSSYTVTGNNGSSFFLVS